MIILPCVLSLLGGIAVRYLPGSAGERPSTAMAEAGLQSLPVAGAAGGALTKDCSILGTQKVVYFTREIRILLEIWI